MKRCWQIGCILIVFSCAVANAQGESVIIETKANVSEESTHFQKDVESQMSNAELPVVAGDIPILTANLPAFESRNITSLYRPWGNRRATAYSPAGEVLEYTVIKYDLRHPESEIVFKKQLVFQDAPVIQVFNNSKEIEKTEDLLSLEELNRFIYKRNRVSSVK